MIFVECRPGVARGRREAHTAPVSAREPDDIPPGVPDLHVPDDARELDADRLAYYRELAARAQADRRPRPASPARWPWGASSPLGGTTPLGGTARPRWSGTLLLGALTTIALLASLLVVLSPRPNPTPVPLPLAADDGRTGDVGSLLPDATVLLGDSPRSLRDARPIVLTALPADGCDVACEQSLAAVWRQAAQYRLRVAVIGPAAQSDAMAAASTAALSGAPVIVDPEGAVDDAYGLTGTSAVLVHADGVVAGVYRDLGPGTRLDDVLATLGSPGAAGTATPAAAGR